MARNWFINGETLVRVKGATGTTIANIQELGLAESPIIVTPEFRHKPINVDAWGDAPAEVQFMLATLTVSMNLIHIDRSILDECLRLSMGGADVIGQLPRAGSTLGNNAARFATGNNYIGLNLSSPVGGKPWRFYFAYLSAPPMSFPLGTEKSVFNLQWTVIPYTTDPWQSGQGADGQMLWDHTNDT